MPGSGFESLTHATEIQMAKLPQDMVMTIGDLGKYLKLGAEGEELLRLGRSSTGSSQDAACSTG